MQTDDASSRFSVVFIRVAIFVGWSCLHSGIRRHPVCDCVERAKGSNGVGSGRKRQMNHSSTAPNDTTFPCRSKRNTRNSSSSAKNPLPFPKRYAICQLPRMAGGIQSDFPNSSMISVRLHPLKLFRFCTARRRRRSGVKPGLQRPGARKARVLGASCAAGQIAHVAQALRTAGNRRREPLAARRSRRRLDWHSSESSLDHKVNLMSWSRCAGCRPNDSILALPAGHAKYAAQAGGQHSSSRSRHRVQFVATVPAGPRRWSWNSTNHRWRHHPTNGLPRNRNQMSPTLRTTLTTTRST